VIEVNITKEMIKSAQDRADKFSFNRKELSKFGSEKSRTIFGYLGEEIIKDFLGIKTIADSYNYDMEYKGYKLEIKTISCKFKPLPHYLCTVNSHNINGIHKQDADYYIFTRIINDQSKAWILGYMKCKEFFEKGSFVKMGTKIVDGVNLDYAHATTLEINKLHRFKKDNG
jgi:hypothetical protein